MKRKVLRYCLWAFTIIIISCTGHKIYDKVEELSEQGWSDTAKVEFEFLVLDNKSLYNTFLKLRYSNEYKFYNFYIQYTLKDSTGKELLKKLDQVILFNPKTGINEGSELAGTIDLESKMFYLSNYQYPYSGKYKLEISQFMRLNPLQGIKGVGVKIERIEHKKG